MPVTLARLGLVILGGVLGLALSLLGLQASQDNLLGWVELFIGVGYLAGGALYLSHPGWQKSARLAEQGISSFVAIAPGFLAVFFTPPIEYIYLPSVIPHKDSLEIAGLGLILAALLLRVWTRLALRGQYNGRLQIQPDHRLVTSGPYRYMRHPGYAGFVLMALGLATCFSSLGGLIVIPLLLIPGLAYRMRVEERLLIEQFGDAYRKYATHTRRLFPGIW